eukprot:TRINITY_DN5168_c0_g1_i1.p1 TRINITY_DN5168_c0_g1~~TRINITY_DN5168_c0_g1_i1.p1  ORF type:complete len:386 (+),score=113.33 TRINITY_DN5168_c0_g1_i1:75-1160(+)
MRDAAQLKGDCDELREAAEQTAKKLAKAQSEAEQVAELKERLAALSEKLAKAEAAPAPSCSAAAHYYNRYADSAPANTPAQVDAFLKALLLLCAEIPGAGPEKQFEDMYDKLIDDVNMRMAMDKSEGVVYGRPEAEAEVRVALLWSTGPEGCAEYEKQPREFCTWLNHVLVYEGCDRPLKLALPFVRTLNRFCVTAPRVGYGDAAPEGRWPGEEMDDVWGRIRKNDWKLFRGGSMPIKHKDWFKPRRVFRQPRYTATSLRQDKAKEFARMRTKGTDGEIPVVWVVLIDKDRKCCHVNHLGDRFSMCTKEDELLFPPHSVFTVVGVGIDKPWYEFGSTLYITIEAAADNKEHPLDLPVAPWC